jgi:hypothetical protein
MLAAMAFSLTWCAKKCVAPPIKHHPSRQADKLPQVRVHDFAHTWKSSEQPADQCTPAQVLLVAERGITTPDTAPYSPYHERYYRNYELNRKRYEVRREETPREPQKGVRGMIPRWRRLARPSEALGGAISTQPHSLPSDTQ